MAKVIGAGEIPGPGRFDMAVAKLKQLGEVGTHSLETVVFAVNTLVPSSSSSYAFIRRAMCVTYHVNRKQRSRPINFNPDTHDYRPSLDDKCQLACHRERRDIDNFVSTSGDK